MSLGEAGLVNQKYALLPAFLQAKGLIRQHVSRCAAVGRAAAATGAAGTAQRCSPAAAAPAAFPASTHPLAPPVPHPPSSFNHFIGSDLLKIIRAKGNERVTCDADPNFYLRCAPW